MVGIEDKLKGHVPIGFYVLKHIQGSRPRDVQLTEQQIKQSVRDHVGAVASLKAAVEIKRLPKTRSGKVARNTIACMIHRKPYVVS